jgi:hypothetical protein
MHRRLVLRRHVYQPQQRVLLMVSSAHLPLPPPAEDFADGDELTRPGLRIRRPPCIHDAKEDPMTRRRWIPIAVLVAVLGGLLYFVLTRGASEPDWQLDLRASKPRATPWATVAFAAQPHVRGSDDAIATAGWTWKWSVDDHAIAGDGATRSWRSGVVGVHRVTVTATSAAGTTRSAEVELEIRTGPTVSDVPGGPPPPIDPAVTDVPFGFADIEVEKSEICLGEPTLIRTTATSSAGSPANLITVIAGEQGSARDFVRFEGKPGVREIAMQLRDPDLPGKYAEEKVYVELKDCAAPAALVVDQKADPMVADRYAFATALIRVSRDAAPEKLPAAAAYAWDFGDGTTQVTTEPDVGHTFPPEAARKAEHFHTYLVTVDALDAGGQSIAAAHSTTFVYDLRRQSKDRFGLIELPAHFRDLAETDDNGDRAMPVTLDNIDDTETARLTGIELRSLSCDGKTQTSETVPVDTVFPSADIAPGASLTGTFVFPDGASTGICRVFATVTGTSAPGALAVSGSFAMTVGDAFRKPITDEQQLATIRTVIQILGTTSFTQEDVQRLEDEGRIPRGVLAQRD